MKDKSYWNTFWLFNSSFS